MEKKLESVAALLLSQRKHDYVPIKGIIHVGASTCEEMDDYKRLGVEKILWIEGNTDSVSLGRRNVGNDPSQLVVESFLSHQNGYEKFYFTMLSSQNDSLMKPCTWYSDVAVKDTKTVQVRRLDVLLAELGIDVIEYNTLVVDVQGAELKVLIGCGDILNRMDFVVSEAWYDELEILGTHIYEGGTPISKLKYFMEDIYKFGETVRIPTEEQNPQHTHSWLDVLFERNH